MLQRGLAELLNAEWYCTDMMWKQTLSLPSVYLAESFRPRSSPILLVL